MRYIINIKIMKIFTFFLFRVVTFSAQLPPIATGHSIETVQVYTLLIPISKETVARGPIPTSTLHLRAGG